MARAARLSGADPDDEDYEEFEEMLEQAQTAQVSGDSVLPSHSVVAYLLNAPFHPSLWSLIYSHLVFYLGMEFYLTVHHYLLTSLSGLRLASSYHMTSLKAPPPTISSNSVASGVSHGETSSPLIIPKAFHDPFN